MLAIEDKEVELHKLNEEFKKKKAEYTANTENPETGKLSKYFGLP